MLTFEKSPTTVERPPSSPALTPPASRLQRWVWRLSIGNLLLAAGVWVLIRFVSERWWLSTAVVYLPRSPLLVPSLLLALVSLLVARKAVLLNLAAGLLIAGPVMGASLNLSPVEEAAIDKSRSRAMRVLSCNVQSFLPDFPLELTEIAAARPDLVAFQEAFGESQELVRYFDGWTTIRENEYFVAARHPLRLLATCQSEPFDRIAAIAVEVAAPRGKFLVFNVHQTTARHGLTNLTADSLISGAGIAQVERHIQQREEEALAVRAFIEQNRGDLPVLIVGDFNMPDDSSIYQACWGDLQNAFQQVGTGYGYTAPCQTKCRWPTGFPWARVDHILTDDHWKIHRCRIGEKDGSDHRLITAIVELR